MRNRDRCVLICKIVPFFGIVGRKGKNRKKISVINSAEIYDKKKKKWGGKTVPKQMIIRLKSIIFTLSCLSLKKASSSFVFSVSSMPFALN
jgi:hypothetical protein